MCLPEQLTILKLEEEIADLLEQFPRHSIPPTLIDKLDELEEALEQERAKLVNQES